MFKLPKEIIQKLESLDFKIEIDEQFVTFYKASSWGQDFSFTIDHENDIDILIYNINEYYLDFDVSHETYLWLDKDGHGKNGAPYEMIDVYKDMVECEEFIKEAGYWIEQLSQNLDMPSIENIEESNELIETEDISNEKSYANISR